MNLSKKVIGLSLATTIAFINLSANECKELSYKDSNYNESLKTIKIQNNTGSIGEYTVQIKDKIVKIFIPNSDSIVTNSELIDNGNGKCKVGRLLSVK